MLNVVRLSPLLGALLAAISVAMGAYAAHGLDKLLLSSGFEMDLQQRLDWFETGVRYQMYHALGLVFVGLIGRGEASKKWLSATAAMFLLGILLFSGSLYAMTLTHEDYRSLFGKIVPLGGVSYIVGWVLMAIATWKS